MHNQLGIDMGAANLLVSAPETGIMLREPSVIAVNRDSGKVLAVGAAAEQKLNMQDKTIAFSRPFGDGLTGTPAVTSAVISSCLESMNTRDAGTDVLLAVPCDLTDEQEDVLVGIAKRAGAGTCHLVYAPLAAIAGTFLKLPRGCLSVDIGATKTNVMLICRGRIYYMKSIMCGGQSFDRAIADYVLRKRKVRISYRTAEQIKITIGGVLAGSVGKTMSVTGKDAAGRTVNLEVNSAELYDALEEPMGAILEAVWVAVSKIPSEYVKTVFNLGIQLSGGGAKLDGIDRMIGGVTGVAAHRVDDPMGCIAKGLSEIQEQLFEEIPPAFRNISEIYIKRLYAMDEGEN